jgi:hypothetical protein
VYDLFRANPGKGYIRDEVFKLVFEPDEKLRRTPPTSIGRALSNLTNAGVLRITDTMRPGVIYGDAPQHEYRLVIVGEQTELNLQ